MIDRGDDGGRCRKLRPATLMRLFRALVDGRVEAFGNCRNRDRLASLDARSRDDLGRHRVATELALRKHGLFHRR
jgi:hypothetical protein